MAVTTDIGDAKDIHPRNKKDVGDRLDLLALHNTYGYKLISQGPIFKRMKIEGDKIIVDFKNIGTGLKIREGGMLNGFLIAEADRIFRPAKAFILNNH